MGKWLANWELLNLSQPLYFPPPPSPPPPPRRASMEPDSPAPVQRSGNILGSFLRSRPRGISTSAPLASPDASERPPPLPTASPAPPSPGGARRANQASPPPPNGSFTQMLRRRRSGGVAQAQTQALLLPTPSASLPPASSFPPATAAAAAAEPPRAHRLRLVPHIDSRRSLRFDAITRSVPEAGDALRIGRFTDRSGLGVSAANALGSSKLAFKSKVVSRAHAEIWCEAGGKFFIRDTKSSSGTFLNHVRLSAAAVESRPYELRDGDTLQLGVDYQGGNEDIYKCVRMRVEIGREWQLGANAFNTAALKQLRSFSTTQPGGKSGFPDCCICLFGVRIQQALFLAPCSHAFHYKCIRPLLDAHHPAFACPLCRTFADLEEDVEVDGASIALSAADEEEEPKASAAAAVKLITAAAAGTPVADDVNDGDDEALEMDDAAPVTLARRGQHLAHTGPGAETDVEREPVRRPPPRPAAPDSDAEMGEPEPEPADEVPGVAGLRMRSRSGSPSVEGSGEGSGEGAGAGGSGGGNPFAVGGGAGGEERGAKRKR